MSDATERMNWQPDDYVGQGEVKVIPGRVAQLETLRRRVADLELELSAAYELIRHLRGEA